MRLIIPAKTVNEAFARSAVAAFAAQLDPTIEEIADIKTAISEAVTNAIVHGYKNSTGEIEINASIYENCFSVSVKDKGIGIENIDQALAPMWTSSPETERAGMGFTIMQSFMDEVAINSIVGEETEVIMLKKISKAE